MQSVKIKRGESGTVYGLANVLPGIYYMGIDTEADAILSSLFVKSIGLGASVRLDYFDHTTDEPPAEEPYLVQSHPILAAAGKDKRYFGSLHNKIVARLTVATAAAEVGVYVTSVNAAAGAFGDGATGDGEASRRFHAGDQLVTTPGVQQTLLGLNAAAVGRDIRAGLVSCRQEGFFRLVVAGTIVASGRTGPATPNAPIVLSPAARLAAGDTAEIVFTARTGSPASDVEAYLSGLTL